METTQRHEQGVHWKGKESKSYFPSSTSRKHFPAHDQNTHSSESGGLEKGVEGRVGREAVGCMQL